MATLGNPKNTIEILQKYQFVFQKKFGQNFLIDTHVLEKIMNAAQISKDDCVVEVGPGIGTMTQYLCEAAKQVVAVEIDKMPGAEALEAGQQVYLQNMYGQPFPVKVTAKDESTITFDANHEMAGKELNFQIEIVEIL